MSVAPQHTFTVTLSNHDLELLEDKLKAQGIDTSKTSGVTPPEKGVVLDYSLRPGTEEGTTDLTMTVSTKPFFITTDYVETEVKKLIGVV